MLLQQYHSTHLFPPKLGMEGNLNISVLPEGSRKLTKFPLLEPACLLLSYFAALSNVWCPDQGTTRQPEMEALCLRM